MKTLYLHIGIHKTGTTALQNVLRKNEKVLKNHGVLYPRKGCVGESNHSLLAWELTHKDTFDPKKGGMDDVISEINQSGCPTAILSGEDFEFLFDIEQIKALDKKFRGAFDVFIIVYLRRQDEVLRSEYIQWVKTGSVDSDFDLFCQFFSHHPRFFFHNLLNRWSEVFGKEKLIIKIYDKSALRQHNIVHDFFHVIGLEDVLGQISIGNKRHNISPGHKSVLAMLFVIRLYSVMQKRRGKHVLSQLLREVDELVQKNFSGCGTQFQPLNRQEAIDLLQHFQASNQYIAESYLELSEEPLFPAVQDRIDAKKIALSKNEIDLLYSWFMKRCG